MARARVVVLLTVMAGWLSLILLEPSSGTKHTEEQELTMAILWFRLLMEDTH